MRVRLSLPLILSLLIAIPVVTRTVRAQYLTSPPHRGVEQVPIGNEVYAYLRHLSVRGIIKGYSEVELPISAYEIAEFVKSADRSKLSTAEAALQQKFIRTYAHEPEHAITMFPADSADALFFR